MSGDAFVFDGSGADGADPTRGQMIEQVLPRLLRNAAASDSNPAHTV